MRLLFLFLTPLFLTSCAIREPAVPAATVPARPSTLILVHGLYANQSYFAPLRKRLTSAGINTLSPDLTPSDGSVSITALADQLEDYIARSVPADTPLQLAGHSMGGLIALEYLQRPQYAARCRGLYTIASPHRGTLLANLHSGPGGREMIPNSSFLQNLHRSRPPFPVVTYRSTRDLVIIPNDSSTLPFAVNKVISSAGHNEILDTSALADDLIATFRKRDATASSPARPR